MPGLLTYRETATRIHCSVLTARLSGDQIMINGHALSPQLSVVAAIPADPEPRSSEPPEARTNDLDDRRSLISPLAAVRICPETATTVTECDFIRATAAPDPPARQVRHGVLIALGI